MKKLTVKQIADVGCAAEIPAAFEKEHVEWQAVDIVDWPQEFPYKPEMVFALAHTPDSLLLSYRVNEDCIRAEAEADGGRVWEDSCCEFFFQPDNEGYYNLECNCAGTLLLAYGRGREGRETASREIMARISRISTLGNGTFGLKHGKFSWQLSLRIPFDVYFHHQLKSLKGLTCHGNFYKCGDKTVPHFLSWNKVETPEPDFHRPEFFGEIKFE